MLVFVAVCLCRRLCTRAIVPLTQPQISDCSYSSLSYVVFSFVRFSFYVVFFSWWVFETLTRAQSRIILWALAWSEWYWEWKIVMDDLRRDAQTYLPERMKGPSSQVNVWRLQSCCGVCQTFCCNYGFSPKRRATLAMYNVRKALYFSILASSIQREEVMRKVFVSEKVSRLLTPFSLVRSRNTCVPNKWTETENTCPSISSHVNLVRISTQGPRQVLMSYDVHTTRLSNSWEITMSSRMH